MTSRLTIGVEHLCPSGVVRTGPSKARTIAVLNNRIQELESRLVRLGQDISPQSGQQHPLHSTQHDLRDMGGASGENFRPHEMTAMLDEMALGTSSTKPYAGTEASPFYMAAMMDNEAEPGLIAGIGNPLTHDVRQDHDTTTQVPWVHTGGLVRGNLEDLPGALLDRCKGLLPSKQAAKDMFERYWELLTWR